MFYRNPKVENARVLFCYKNFKTISPASHEGLGISSLLACKVLRKQGVSCDLRPVNTSADIESLVKGDPAISHCIIQAPWIPIQALQALVGGNLNVHFVVICHSQVAFLQADPNAVTNLRNALAYQEGTLNFTVAANSSRLQRFLIRSYGDQVILLPNLYDLDDNPPPHWKSPQVKDAIYVASLGALRVMKNHTTAAAAALLLAQQLQTDLKFTISTRRVDGGNGTQTVIESLLANVPYAQLVEAPWAPWPMFKDIVRHQDLCLQVSFTESFNISTADACNAYVPSVVSDAIDWLPDWWQARTDDAEEIARIGLYLLSDPGAGVEGRTALQNYVAKGTAIWLDYLGSNPT